MNMPVHASAYNLLLTRRGLLRLSLSAGTIALVTACAPATPVASTPPTAVPLAPTAVPAAAPAPTSAGASLSATTAPAAAQPQKGGTFIIAVEGEPGSLNEMFNNDATEGTIVNNIYNRLLKSDRSSNPVPDLAESWTTSDDNLTF